MREYIRLLEELGLEVTEASVSRLSGYWFIRARDEEGLEYAWAVDPARGPIADDLDEEVVPLQALEVLG